MSLADTLSYTDNGTTYSLKRVQTDPIARFVSDGRECELRVQHEVTRNGRVRSNISMQRNSIVTDPYLTDRNVPIFSTIGLTLNTPSLGDLVATRNSALALLATLQASSNAVMIAFGNQEK